MKSILSSKRSHKAAPIPTPASSDPAPVPKYTPRGGSKNRILIAVKDERIDFQAMTADSSKALNDLMHLPEVQKQFGIGPLTEGFDPRHCKRIYQAFGYVLMGFGKAVRWAPEAVATLAYTDAEQEELAKPTASVLDDLAPKWIREHQALTALVLVFGTMTQQKLQAAAALALEIKRAKATAASSFDPGTRRPPQGTAAAPPETDSARVRIPINIAPDPKANGSGQQPESDSPPPNLGGISGVSPKF